MMLSMRRSPLKSRNRSNHCLCERVRYISTWVRDDPKLSGNSGLVPKLNGVVGGSISGHENHLSI